jgi:hypothetical protein
MRTATKVRRDDGSGVRIELPVVARVIGEIARDDTSKTESASNALSLSLCWQEAMTTHYCEPTVDDRKREHAECLSVDNLRYRLAEQGLDVDGSRETLVKRLKTAHHGDHAPVSAASATSTGFSSSQRPLLSYSAVLTPSTLLEQQDLVPFEYWRQLNRNSNTDSTTTAAVTEECSTYATRTLHDMSEPRMDLWRPSSTSTTCPSTIPRP